MKVLLINAPSVHAAVTTADWDTTAEDIGAFPPIGLSYLAGYLQKYTDHQVSILDTLALRMDAHQIEKHIRKVQPDLVGITAFTPTFYDVLQVCKMAKKSRPDCLVCLGGSHVDTFTEETMFHPEVDFCVHGEGEVIFAELLQAIEKGAPLSGVKGITFKQGGQLVGTGQPGYHKDLNTLPPPAFNLLPLDRYKSAIGTGAIVGVIASSRGCPYHCTYCNRPYQTYRQYSVERIMQEMHFHYQRGTREFLFFDDMFNITPKRVIEISQAIKANFPDIIWSFRGRVDQVTEEMVQVAMDSGLSQILFGVEAGSDEDLKAIRKNITTQQVIKAMAICKKLGLETSTNWIIGLPTHKSRQDIINLLNFAIKTGTDYAQFNILIPYIETPIFAEGVAKGILPTDFWPDYVRHPRPNVLIPIWEENLTRAELSQLLKTCYRRFYLQPNKVIKQVLSVRTPSHFITKFKGMLTILGFGGLNQKKRDQELSAEARRS